MGLQCVLTSSSSVRKTKAQLQRELESLKGNGIAGNNLRRDSYSAAGRPPSSANGYMEANDAHCQLPPPTASSFSISPTALPDPSHALSEHRCSSRSLEGQNVEAKKIQDCFTLFFRHYLPLIPILDQQLTPNQYHDLSPFLFWTIVFVGSRRYSKDPILLSLLSPRMNTMALQALESRSTPIQTIQASLLLCLWPVPINTMHRDFSHILSGAATSLAMQIGLHVTGSGQDFARTRLHPSIHTQKLFRAQLWMHCLIIRNSTSLREGISPLILADPTTISLDDDTLYNDCSLELRMHRKMHAILMSATLAIIRTLPTTTSSTQPNALSPFIQLFDAQFLSLVPQGLSAMNTIYLHCSRLHILTYYFFESPASPDKEGMVRLHTVSCNLIEDIIAQDQKDHLVEICPQFIEKAVTLAALSILKIQRSELVPLVDLSAGEKAYFSAILFCRGSSLENDDLGARGVSILSQLWTSQNIFKRSDGRVESLGTRIRSRLSMSIVFDCFWWWREEFAGQISPYRDDSQPSVSSPAIEESGSQSQVLDVPPPNNMTDASFMFLDEPFPDYDWAANMDLRDFEIAVPMEFYTQSTT
ncbi:Fc.00g072620.m01.CDS01 [Cosmosporella sp. VM-42]